MKFEEQMEQLRALTQQLEQGNLSLEEAVSLYTQGVKLAADCQKTLENAKLKVEMMTVTDEEAKENDSTNEFPCDLFGEPDAEN